jgi:hypothetical protein
MSRIIHLIPALAMASLSIGQCVTSYPAPQDFESAVSGNGTAPGTMVSGWTQLTTDDFNWWVENGDTPTSGTGPTANATDHNPGTAAGRYIYCEASSPNNPAKTAIIQSPCYNLGGLSSPYLLFWYHMYSDNGQMGSLHVDVNNNGSITSNVWQVSGNQGDVWRQAVVSLAAFGTGTNVSIRFRGITGTGTRSDICVDDLSVRSFSPVYGCTDPAASNYNPSANVDDGSCTYSCPTGQKRVVVTIVPDNYPGEISWDLRNAQTNAILMQGTSSGSNLCVPENTCMTFNIHDSYGDGICCGYGIGSYTVTWDGVVVATGGDYGSGESTSFNCPPGFSCNSAVTIGTGQHTAPSLEHWYDFTPAQTGSYTITTCGLNTCDTKIWIYDLACGQINPQPGLEGATFHLR